MRLVVLGANGQVGHELQRSLKSFGEVIALDRNQADLTQLEQLKQTLIDLKPDVIVNAAAYTAVDKAEEDEEAALIINGVAPGVIADTAKQLNTLLIHYSTDYVFDGNSASPYKEDDPVSPQSVYGKTKLQGEMAVTSSGANHLILRTSWVYGLHGNNFLLTMLRLFKERDELGIVEDQIGAPTSAYAIANATSQIIDTLDSEVSLAKNSGIYHLTAAGQTSWYGFANAILKSVADDGYQCKLTPISTEQYPTPAARPAYSVLDNSKLFSTFGVQLPSWESQLESVMQKWHENH